MLKPPVPSYNDLIPLLLSHELRNKSLLSESANPNLAFLGQRSAPRYQNKHGQNSSFTSKGRGFTQSSSRPAYNHRNPQRQSTESRHSPQQHYELCCQICRKKNHDALRCWHQFDNSYQDDQIPKALAALHLNPHNEGEWLPDTGATTHITDDPGSKHASGDGIGE
ncbi:ABC-type xenobiotic transporter [Ranunculus cassubicifolius]